MGAASVSEYVASLNEEQRRRISAFIDFMSAEYPQLIPKISYAKYKQALEYISAHGSASFLNAAEHWTGAYGKYLEQGPK